MEFVEQSFKIDGSIDGIAIAKKIERCGKVCYKAEHNITDDSYIRFLKMIIKNQHESVLEHVSITVKAYTDRGITHEIVRHRLAAYSQESTRYCNYCDEKFDSKYNKRIKVILPKSLENDHRVIRLMGQIEDVYNALIDEGIKPQDARDILPTCLKSEIVMTYNLREWRWFFIKRCEVDAHPKIRDLACGILKEFHDKIPVVFDDLYDRFIPKYEENAQNRT
ncbi:MAG: FAD-dependent thymidylate synthase [Alphaproteobacteria bacterium]|nr:FAD-dependent thymidylate synthase [Alphaproteobacteria bacterium]